MKEGLTVKQVSECLNVSRQTIMQWIIDGRFAGAWKDEGLTGWWFIPVSGVEGVRQEIIAEFKAEIEAISRHPNEWLKKPSQD